MVCFEVKEVSTDLKCVLLSELHIHILIRYQLHEWVFLSEAREMKKVAS